MRLPLSWVREYAPISDADAEPAEVSRRLTAAGLEVESAEQVGHDIQQVIVAEVLEIEELTGFKKPIRFCRLSSGDPSAAPHEVICGAVNFVVGDRVALALPGAQLPGGVTIGAKPAYGRMSAGMICSAAELAIGDDHAGILVLPADAPLGADFVAYANLRDEVFEIAVTPDRGYAVSVRGIARELASAFGVPFTEPAGAGRADPALLGGALDVAGTARPGRSRAPRAARTGRRRPGRRCGPGRRPPPPRRARRRAGPGRAGRPRPGR